MTTLARLRALALAWPLMSRDLRAELIRKHPRTFLAMRRLARRERGKS